MSLITYLTRIQFAAGAIGLLGEELAQLGVSRPLIVTDKGIVKAGLLDTAIAAAGLKHEIPVFDATPENPTEQAALDARDRFRRANCDSIIALGGGSSLDLAKAVALLVPCAWRIADPATAPRHFERGHPAHGVALQ